MKPLIGQNLMFCFTIWFNKEKKCIGFALFCAAGAFLTGSRKALMIVMLGTFFIAYFFYQGKNKMKIIVVGIVLVAVMYLLIMNVPVFYDTVGYRFDALVEGTKSGEQTEGSAIVREHLTEYAINNGFTFHEQENINDGFYFQRPEWKRTCIKICRSGNRHYIGISNSIDGSEEDLAALPQQKLECFDDSPNLWWPYGNTWLEKYDDWSAATDTIPAMIDGSFVNFIIDIVDAIILELQNKKCKMI